MMFNSKKVSIICLTILVTLESVGLTASKSLLAENVESFRGSKALKILDKLAKRSAGNWKLIQTLEATYTFRHESTVGGEYARFLKTESENGGKLGEESYIQSNEGEFQIAYSAASQSFSSRCKNDHPATFHGTKDGKKLEFGKKIAVTDLQAIVTAKEMLHFSPNLLEAQSPEIPLGDGTPGRVAYRDAPTAALKRQWPDVINPHLLFTFDATPIEEWLSAFSKHYANASADEREQVSRALVVTRIGKEENATFEVTLDLGPKWILLFEPSADGLLTRFTQILTNPEARIEQNWNYVRENAILLPQKIERREWRNKRTQPALSRVMQLESFSLNKPIDATRFTWKSFGLKDGERLFDKNTKEWFVLENGELLVNNGRLGTKEGRKSGVNIRTLFFFGNVTAVVATIAFLLYRRRKMSGQSS